MYQEQEHWLLISGLFLFLLGLLNGAIIQSFKNKRMGLSAHLTGVQNGMVLLLFGFLWSRLTLPPFIVSACYWLSLYSMYSIWLGLLLAAIWGASRSAPIAGTGYRAKKYQENIVHVLIVSGSLAIIFVTITLICGLW